MILLTLLVNFYLVISMPKYNPIFFKPSEFVKCSPSCSIEDLHPDLLLFLDRLRKACGFPIVLNSAYRSKEYELSKGRSGTSSHCKGLAVDIRCLDSFHRCRIVGCICELADRNNEIPVRIGIASTYIHVDIDCSKPDSIWLY